MLDIDVGSAFQMRLRVALLLQENHWQITVKLSSVEAARHCQEESETWTSAETPRLLRLERREILLQLSNVFARIQFLLL